MNRPIAVLLADDHALVREMLVRTLQEHSGFEVVDQVACGEDAVERAAQLAPDVVVLDIDMPGLSAFEAARAIKGERPEVRVLFLSAFYHDRYIEQAMGVEADGYVTKNESPETLLSALDAVASGRIYFSPEVQARIVVEPGGLRLAEAPQTRVNLLTPREREVLGHIARGLPKKQMARLLGISPKTVEQHCAHLMNKLDIHDRVELARFAIREGLVEP